MLHTLIEKLENFYFGMFVCYNTKPYNVTLNIVFMLCKKIILKIRKIILRIKKIKIFGRNFYRSGLATTNKQRS